ncbi:MAG: amino acid ABC transporter permease [Pseudomonadota bacterium]
MTDMPNTGNSALYVRREMLAQQPPPPSTVGVVGWLRENLFRGPVNSTITVLILLMILWLAPGIASWAFIDATWNAKSLSECRQLGEGACWAVIVERFGQFIYGFYPAEERWRPNLAFLLMLLAFAFALFDEVPGVSKEVWARIRPGGLVFSAVFPFIAYWLIWGGSIWGPIGLVATPVVGYFAAVGVDKLNSQYGPFLPDTLPVPSIVGLVAALVWLLGGMQLVAGALTAISPEFFPLWLPAVESKSLGGFLLATIIGVAGIVLSLPIGILLALGRRSGLFFIQTVCIVFIECMRGVPLITLLFVASTTLSFLFPPDSNLDELLRVVIMVTIFASAYMAEVIRGGLASLPPGQYEAADAMGLNYWQATRLIIMPQALKVSIPNIVNTFIGLFKDTTLVAVIGLLDVIGLITATRADSAWNGINWELYIFAALFFFIACFAMSRYSMYLERKLATDRR